MLLNSRSGTLRPPVWKKWLRIMMLLVALVAVGGAVVLAWAHYSGFRGERHRLKPIQAVPPHTDPVRLAKMDSKSPLIWSVKLDQIPRPQYVIEAFTDQPHPDGHGHLPKRADHHSLAQQAVRDALTLRQQGYTFRVIIFAWKRRASLKRLTDSLQGADYHGFTVHLDFHLDGGANQRVTDFVDEFSWPHGRVRVNRHAERVGLERVSVAWRGDWLIINGSTVGLDNHGELAADQRSRVGLFL